MEPGCVVKALYDFEPGLEGELPVRKGDLIQVVGPVDKHWTLGQLRGQRGRFPSACVLPVKLPPLSPGEELFAASADYSSGVPGDLCFQSGDLVVGLGAVDGNWWRGRLEGGSEGLFPLSHAWKLDGAGSGAQPQEVDLWARACQDTTAQLGDELSLRAGQLIHVRRIIDQDWLWGECDSQCGKFPRSLVVLLPDGETGEAPVSQQAVDCPDAAPGTASQARAWDVACRSLDPGLVAYGRSRFAFSAQYPNELSLEVGDLVTLVRHVDDEWTEGELGGRRGLFPTAYVDVIVDCAEGDAPEGPSQRPCFGRALFDFPAGVQGDLALSAGEVIVLLGKVNADWYQARSRDGRTGICPTSFVEEMARPGVSEGLRSRFNSAPVSLELRRREEPLRRANTLGSAESAAFKREVASFHQLKPVTRPAPSRPPPAVPSATAPLPSRSAPPVPLACAEPPRTAAVEGSSGSGTTTNQAGPAARQQQEEEKRRKLRDHRQCVLTELLQTERDYLQALQICAQVYLSDASRSRMQSLDIDAATLFGNMDEVIAVSSRLLGALEEELVKPESAQLVGACFVKAAEELKEAYGHYCRNHDDVSGLWMKCMENPRAAQFLQAGVARMQQESNCFDLPSVLIRPVQRILKYPLLIHELDKSTEAGHPDKPMLARAMAEMSDVATSINECKRRKDLVCKYRTEPGDSTLSRRLAKLNLHSVLKKSSRFGVRLSSTLGLTSVEKDESFEQAEREFRVLEKALRLFLKNLALFCDQVKHVVHESLQLSEDLVRFYHDRAGLPEVERYRAVQHAVCSQHWQQFASSVERDVEGVLKQLLQLFVGPSKLISKRQHKLLDYAASKGRLERNRDFTRHKALSEEQQLAKNTYEALNAQLLEELPQLCSIARQVLHATVQELLRARKLFIGRTTRELLALMELPAMLGAKGGNVLDLFRIKHTLVLDSLAQQPGESNLFRALQAEVPARGTPRLPAPPLAPAVANQGPQREAQRVFVQSSYPVERVYVAVEDYASADILDLSLRTGDVVGVVKQQDPMGNAERWFVDNGAVKGFVAARFLRPLHQAPVDPPPPYSATDPLLPSPKEQRKSCMLGEISPPRMLQGTCQPPASATVLPRPAASMDSQPAPLPPAPTVLQVQVSQVAAVPGAALPPGDTAQLPVVPAVPSAGSAGKAAVTSYNYTFAAERHPYEEIPEEQGPSIGSPVQEGPRYANLEFDPLGTAQDDKPEGEAPPAVNEYYYALYPFSATGPHQLSVAQGQVLLVVHQSDLHANPEWWFVQDRHGNGGYVPGNYLSRYQL